MTIESLPAPGPPSYLTTLDAYQRSREPELRAILTTLPLCDGDRVLDLACGTGAYTRWLGELPRDLRITGVDLNPTLLGDARRQAPEAHVARCEASTLPFADGSFDLALCVQSFYSLPDPVATLVEMRSVVRPGGHVAVLENDSLHQLVLPWPAELELAVREAHLQSLRAEHGEASLEKFYAGRHMPAFFAESGLDEAKVTAHPVERSAPLSDDERCFLHGYITDLGRRVSPYLSHEHALAFRELFDPNAPSYLFTRDDFHLVQLELLTVARRA